jgi:hypothetical protein
VCQRYYAQCVDQFSGNVTSGSIYRALAAFPVTMRPGPAFTATNLSNSGFAATVGTFAALGQNVQEARTANLTTPAAYGSVITVNARM